ncbi:MAG: nucleotidyltransferase family protein [Acidobacteriota bacterium]|nr:nucleotidyltransferase family protein [Acidobacteriota bacterium]
MGETPSPQEAKKAKSGRQRTRRFTGSDYRDTRRPARVHSDSPEESPTTLAAATERTATIPQSVPETPATNAAGILLAAGESKRMRRIKALLPHPDGSGRTLVRTAAETLLAAGLAPVIVVLGHARREIAPELRGLTVRAVPNPAHERGMLSSLQVGIRALAPERHIFWTVVAPLDQPFLSAGLVRRLIATATGPRQPPAAVVPATLAMERTGTWGLPVVLRRRLFPEVLELSGTQAEAEGRDRGAGRVLARHRPDVLVVPASERELLDLDDWASYERARRAPGATGG